MLGAVVVGGAALAQPAPQPPLRLEKALNIDNGPQRRGYAFDYPRILAQQRVFGLAHGAALLAAACRAVPASAEAAGAAYASWRRRQGGAIAAAAADMSTYYYGGGVADWQSLATQLGLREALGYAPDSPELAAACATLPQALEKPRYDLRERIRLEELMVQVAAGVETEARDTHCRSRLPAAVTEQHAARYGVWREINEPLLKQAMADLATAWPADAPAATFADWLAELRRTTTAGGSLADCLAFSESLKQPQAALRNAFAMPPPPPQTQ